MQGGDGSVDEMMGVGYHSYPMVPEAMVRTIVTAIKRYQTTAAGMNIFDIDLTSDGETTSAGQAVMESGMVSATEDGITGGNRSASIVSSSEFSLHLIIGQ